MKKKRVGKNEELIMKNEKEERSKN